MTYSLFKNDSFLELLHNTQNCFKQIEIDLPPKEQDFIKFLTEQTDPRISLEVVKFMPLYPAGECHQNCCEYVLKHKPKYTMLKGWAYCFFDDHPILVYHSIIMEVSTEKKYDITCQPNCKKNTNSILY
jgi:hypothetical protein